ncbi:MAG: alpha-glucan family phosphorylase [Thermoleophilia bacterium]|nr:alpha-glucan family phosphorylase [Thermoleophilia bacterium]
MTAQPYHAVPRVPDSLSGLLELALDLRWSWSHASDALWHQIAPDIWRVTHNPWHILQTVGQDRLEEVAADAQFTKLLEGQLASRRALLDKPSWFERHYAKMWAEYSPNPNRVIAYFCMEFGLSEALPIYGGGLGILAGDFLKTASDLGVPLVGVGILWQQGYFRQALSASGEQLEFFPYNDPGQLPIQPLRDKDGEWVIVEIEFPRRTVRLRAWQVQTGRTRLYLLDSNDLLNSPADRGITSELYGGGAELRLQQEMVLGIGGWKLLRKVGLDPTICHLNEGHAALAVLARAQSFMEDHRVDFETALTATRVGNVFTTHTPVEAGFDRFPPDLVEQYLGPYAQVLGITFERLLALASEPNPPSSTVTPEAQVSHHAKRPFNMAYLAIRGSAHVNGVSRLHGQVSRALFQNLFPRWPRIEVPIGHVTNGVHVPSWDSDLADDLWTKCCGKDRWLGEVGHLGECIRSLSDEEIWAFRCASRARLIAIAREHVMQQEPVAGNLDILGENLTCLCNPDVLTLGFARRFASYKRPDLLLHDPDRLERILCAEDSRAQLILAGKAHPADLAGKAMIKRWTDFISRCTVRPHVVFLVDYDMDVAEHLVQGVDVWINTPRRPWEASGTSGMKVLVNGGLNLSVLDGWWAEAYAPEVGWALGDGLEHGDDPYWDARDAAQLYDLLETQVIPEFYDRDENGIPRRWVARVRESMARLTPQFSTNRMMKEYLENYYLPAAADYQARTLAREGQVAALARELVIWRTLLDEHWDKIRFISYQAETKATDDGAVHSFAVEVDLGPIPLEAVLIELYAEPLAGDIPERHVLATETGPEAAHDTLGGRAPASTSCGAQAPGRHRLTATLPALRPADHYTPRIIPWHAAAKVPLEANQILWLR